MAEEWDDYDAEDIEDKLPSTRVETVIQAAAERVAQSTNPRLRPRAPKYGPQTYLREKTKNLAWTGDTVRDLDKLMSLYRDWAHYMYPKFVFRDFVDKTERQCRTQSMKAYYIALKRAYEEGGEFDELAYTAEKSMEQANAALQDIPDVNFEMKL